MTFPANSELITKAAEGVATFFGQINWTQPSWDLLVLFVFLAAVFLCGIVLDKSRFVILLISIYIALVVMDAFTCLRKITPGAFLEKIFNFQIIIFFFLFFVLLFFLPRSGFFQGIGGRGRWGEIILFSVLHAGLLISVTFSFLPAEFLKQSLPFTQIIFNSDLARFLWITLPVIVIILTREDKMVK